MGWKWRKFEDLPTNITKIKTLMDILQQRSLVLSTGSNSIIWLGANSGCYNLKDGYNSIVKKIFLERTKVIVSLYWDKRCLPKAGYFSWPTLQGRILTIKWFRKLG